MTMKAVGKTTKNAAKVITEAIPPTTRVVREAAPIGSYRLPVVMFCRLNQFFPHLASNFSAASRYTDFGSSRTPIFETYRGRAITIIGTKYTSVHAPPPTNFHHFLSSVV